jgi:NADPH-dependent curcumin reductase CurA
MDAHGIIQMQLRRGRHPMNVGKIRQWILNARPTGKLTGEEYRWNQTSVAQPSDVQVLVRNL